MQESSESAQRRERAAIAAQACQTCRNRKSKCDEQRPKCEPAAAGIFCSACIDALAGSLCQRLNVECQYREPLPTKKDKTMVYILETLARVEDKLDKLAVPSHAFSPGTSVITTRGRVNRSPDTLSKGADQSSMQLRQRYKHLTSPHKILLWPCIYLYIVNFGIQDASDFQHLMEEGTPWFIKRDLATRAPALSPNMGLPSFPLSDQSPGQNGTVRYGFPGLTAQRIQMLCDAYFSTFNVLSPVLNRDSFMSETFVEILEDGFADGESQTVLMLLVLALGQVAIDGVFELPISMVAGNPSGIRGGTAQLPPGIEIFNEARRRVGLVSTHMTLEGVQFLLLEATYYEATARHLNFWQSTAAASMACQVLIKCQPIDWESPYGDLVTRAYWACLLSEDFYHLDLDLPKSGAQSLEDTVPLPYFHEARHTPGEEPTQFQYHFLAMIALRRLISRIHEMINESSDTQAEQADDFGGPALTVIREMARQLESWRTLLPRALQWQDSDRFDYPNIDPVTRRPSEPLFAPHQGPVPIGHRGNLDVVNAQLRTRFYYARFMIYRPFVYKALHFPEFMTSEDRSCCALALKSALLWPMLLAPPKNKKRLVPHLFTWTHNCIAILLILRMTTENECLKSICEEQVNKQDMESTVALMLDWIRDIRQVDRVADWSWNILEPIFTTDS